MLGWRSARRLRRSLRTGTCGPLRVEAEGERFKAHMRFRTSDFGLRNECVMLCVMGMLLTMLN